MKEVAGKNPSLGFWLQLKDALLTQEGYFDRGMKGALIPPEGQPPLQGTVISQEGLRAAKSVTLGVDDPKKPEVTLTFETPLPGHPEPGTVITFRGDAVSFSKEPFMLTFASEKKWIGGWPAPAPPKKAPVHKTPKKK